MPSQYTIIVYQEKHRHKGRYNQENPISFKELTWNVYGRNK